MHRGDKGPATMAWQRWVKRGQEVERPPAAAKDQHESQAQSVQWDFWSVCAYVKGRRQESVRKAAGSGAEQDATQSWPNFSLTPRKS